MNLKAILMNINFYYFILQIFSKMSWIVIEVDVRFATKVALYKIKIFFALFGINKNSDPKASRNVLWHLHTNFSIHHIFVLNWLPICFVQHRKVKSVLVVGWNMKIFGVKLNIGKIPIGGNIFGEFIRFMFSPLMKVLNETVSIPKDF